MKRLCVALVVFWVGASVYADGTNGVVAAEKKVTKRYKATGGRILVPNSQKGKIAIFNAQKKVSLADYRAPLDSFGKQYKYKVDFVECADEVSPKTASDIMKRSDAQVAVFLTSCDECSIPMLVAPDVRWAIVNVAALAKDAKNDVFVAARTRKTLMRAFLCAAGAMNSQFEGSEMAPIKHVADLDKVIEDPPLDVIMRVEAVLKFAGVIPAEYTTYLNACQQGWAPKPADEYQQKIWDDVHALPTKPLKIEK